MSIRLCFFNETEEEYLGFVELEGINAMNILKAIEDFVTNLILNPDKYVGLGFDGCSTMSRKKGDVQAILRQ